MSIHRAVWLVFAAVGVVVVCRLAAVAQPPRPAAAAQPEKVVKWEYCSVQGSSKGQCKWLMRDRIVDTENWKELAAKLNVEGKKKDAEGSSRLAVFNHLGADGWEMVSQSAMVAGASYVEEWIFKRRIP